MTRQEHTRSSDAWPRPRSPASRERADASRTRSSARTSSTSPVSTGPASRTPSARSLRSTPNKEAGVWRATGKDGYWISW